MIYSTTSKNMNSSSNYLNNKSCRICKSNQLKTVVRIKPQYIASTFVKTNENNPLSKIKIPLTLMLCTRCGLAQLRETVKQDLLYKNYFYRSAISNTMKRDLQDVVTDVISKVTIKKNDRILDIGCNDGLMLTMFPKIMKRMGVEPAKNIDWKGLQKSIEIINDYFPNEEINKYKFKIITATAMFYDLHEPNVAVKQIKELLDKDGVCCIQVSYLYDTIKDMNFYDICHEHLEYYCLKTLQYLMDRNGMSIFDASTNAVNGGSLRVLVSHKEAKREKSSNLKYLLLKEKVLGLENPQTYNVFSQLININVQRVRSYIKKQKGLVIGLGASTKGNVLLQICGIDKKTLPYISERNDFKVGLRTLGTDILLISEEEARKMRPSCMFVIPWNFKQEIVDREKEYLQKGGKLLFIMPYPYILTSSGETRL